MPTYAIGIDLGTSHCALSYIDRDLSEGEELAHHVLPIPQMLRPGEVAEPALLPSALYLPSPHEVRGESLTLPWTSAPAHLVGEIARALGANSPLRMVSSAKSWLSHQGVDRRARLLPLDAPEDVVCVSPMEASAIYLRHLREAWDHANAGEELAAQDVVVTVPASFDPAARDLTMEAIAAAGYPEATLLEEPLAAVYAWIAQSRGAWRDAVADGDLILVVDVGGGTTDLSLIAVREIEGKLELERVAVGEHILLGGDNIDLALAHTLAQTLLEERGIELDPWQLRVLTDACRRGKEKLLSEDAPESVTLAVPTRGSKLVAGSISVELTRAQTQALVLEGFFPSCAVDEHPRTRARSALTQVSLPYAQDPAITRHLAAFLSKQRRAIAGEEASALEGRGEHTESGARFAHPTALLVNGGVLKANAIRERIVDVLSDWLLDDDADPIRILEGADLDRAVAKGAAYYAYARSEGGVRVHAGLAQSYYVGVESAMPAIPGMAPPIQALCVAPFGLQEGEIAKSPPQELGLVVGEAVRFRFFSSSVRRDDEAGTLLRRFSPSELTELGQIEAKLEGETATVVPVKLRARVTELGALVLEAIASDGSGSWRVETSAREG